MRNLNEKEVKEIGGGDVPPFEPPPPPPPPVRTKKPNDGEPIPINPRP